MWTRGGNIVVTQRARGGVGVRGGGGGVERRGHRALPTFTFLLCSTSQHCLDTTTIMSQSLAWTFLLLWLVEQDCTVSTLGSSVVQLAIPRLEGLLGDIVRL